MSDRLCTTLSNNGILCVKDVPLSPRSSFRVGGCGELGIFPKSAEELKYCLSEIGAEGLSYHVIGNGSNILFLDGRLAGAFVFTEGLRDIRIDGETVYAEAGATLSSVAAKAAEVSLSGLEFARGIPGSLGGAVFMNAGAYGGQMSDVTVSTTAYNANTGETVTLTDHRFGYRKSIYMEKPGLICLCAELKLSVGDREEINGKMRELAVSRRQKQPLEYPSAGSYFKRPEGYFAGKLIEDCGLKGLRVGGAAVSEKHAGFVINLGGATAEDILELEKRVKDAVFEKFGVMLEREVRVIG